MAEVQAPHSKSTQGVADLTGMTVGRFAIHARLGAGGMGEVYRADDTKLKRPVALKRMSPRLRTDEHYRQRFLKEAERASCLADQHIAGVYDVLEEKDETFLVMEYVEGATLRPRLTQLFSLEEFLPVAIQCAEALAAAHENGVIHRDIKPENIMLTPKGQVKILDFGVAKRLPHHDEDASTESTASQPGALSGTPAYMAPEVLLEKPSDERADIFSLGVVFYEMLTAQHPFRAETFMATSDRILHEVPPPLGRLNPQVSEGLERLVARMLAKDPSERYANASDLMADLRAWEEAKARRRLVFATVRSWVRRRRVRTLAILGAVLLAVLTVPRIPWRPRPVEVPQKVHLAVLPFVALGGTAETSAFSKGLTETLNARFTQLTEWHPLQVVPAGEMWAQDVRTVEQARREFGVNLVLTGSVQQAAGMIRITYALIDAATRRQLRADIITAGAGDPFAAEDQVVASVLNNLEIELQPRERSALAAHGTQQPAAYDFYLRGRGYLQDYHKPENIESAIAAFKHALEKDPQYPLAYAGLGEAYWYNYQLAKEPQWVRQALAACERAVALDARLSSGHTCLGVVYNGTGKYELAVEQFRQAVELEPTSDAAHRGLASAYERLGKPKEAEETYRRAIALRPYYWASYSWLGAFYYWQARYAEAAEMFDQVVKLAPDNSFGYSNLGTIYNAQGRYAEAILMCERSAAIRPTGDAYSNLATTYFSLRRFAEATQAYEKAVEIDPRGYLWWGNLGDARYWAPGQRAQAASAYEHAISLAKEDLRVNPRDARALGYLAYYYAMLENKQAALSSIEQALTLTPNDPELRFNAALTHNKLGQINQALEWLGKALAAGWSPATVRDSPFPDNLRTDPRYLQLFQRGQP
jgi:tetratricopeptide (TPR) repeat protein/predicted Ser/Thr protein kinase